MESEVPTTLGQLIREARQAAGFDTQVDFGIALSARAGRTFTGNTLSLWEQDGVRPKREFLPALFEVLKLSDEQIVLAKLLFAEPAKEPRSPR